MVTGEVMLNCAPAIPFCTPAFYVYYAVTPKPGVGLPVFAFIDISLPSEVPNRIDGGVLASPWPIGNTSSCRAAVRQFVDPYFLASLGIQGDDGPVRSRNIQDIVDHDRCGLRRSSAASTDQVLPQYAVADRPSSYGRSRRAVSFCTFCVLI